MSKNTKKILLLCFVLFVLFGLPVIATITATRIYAERHIEEMKEYDNNTIEKIGVPALVLMLIAVCGVVAITVLKKKEF